MKIVSITNQKGGVGKSTTAQALAAGLARRGFKTLIIDLDPQGNTTFSFGSTDSKVGSYELITKKAKLEECVQETTIENLSIVPGAQRLNKLDGEFLNETGSDYQLKEALEKSKFDYIVIDTPPAINVATKNALTASTFAVIPSQTTIYTIEAVKLLAANIARIQKYNNPKLKIAGLLFTRHATRSTISKKASGILEDLANLIGTQVFKTTIPESAAIQEAQTKKKDIFGYAPKNKAAIAYNAFIDELLEK